MCPAGGARTIVYIEIRRSLGTDAVTGINAMIAIVLCKCWLALAVAAIPPQAIIGYDGGTANPLTASVSYTD
ncbi:hypothetical protein PATSB16_27110 [Pandoraea thiooxydans]|uniref:Uncharacterized protein n=1 Tax=Pandoraea thiooxydans TaxID=445709 RepID=A0A0G3EV67_9BURK|nr:hypothetical protein ABW99_10805 [Pandoraea thiooxydans]APR96051.1 hypothetical protein PATSB16_27110 [Pandoraea thiooxydans]